MKLALALPLLGLLLLGLKGCQAEGPAEESDTVRIAEGGFAMDRYEVSVGAFQSFTTATGYRTTADSLGWSGIFDLRLPGWTVAEGANWAYPDGQAKAGPNEPARHISYYDACAYCAWKGGRLPTAEEWDLAAGDEPVPGNIWEGPFPYHDEGKDGYAARPAPIGQFPSNERGIHDLFGNVWEWTSSVFQGQREGQAFIAGQAVTEQASGGRIIKGGSFLCDQQVCSGFIPSRFQVSEEDSGLSHLGFRCVY